MKSTIKLLACIILLLVFVGSFVSCTLDDVNKVVESYEVEFVVDGNIYTTETIFTNAVSASLPSTPFKEGCSFDGWYFDNNTWLVALNSENIKKQPSGKTLTVYAKWNTGNSSALATPTGVSLNGSVLTWTAVPGAKEYNVLVGDNSYATDKTAIDLSGKVTELGSYLIFVQAVSNNDNIADSMWSSAVSYIVEMNGNTGSDHKANTYGVGYGYNILTSPYYDARKAKVNSPLDIAKLSAYIKTTTYSESYATSVKGETMGEYLTNYNTAIGMGSKVSGQGQIEGVPFTANAEANFSSAFSHKYAGHTYQAFFTYFHHIEKNAYVVKDCSETTYRNMLSDDFIQQINRETPETRNLNDEELLIKGVNPSKNHVDLMIGTYDLNIEAETNKGKVLILKNGNFNI